MIVGVEASQSSIYCSSMTSSFFHQLTSDAVLGDQDLDLFLRSKSYTCICRKLTSDPDRFDYEKNLTKKNKFFYYQIMFYIRTIYLFFGNKHKKRYNSTGLLSDK